MRQSESAHFRALAKELEAQRDMTAKHIVDGYCKSFEEYREWCAKVRAIDEIFEIGEQVEKRMNGNSKETA